MLTVACVYWKGQFRGRENVYSEVWVERLKNMVSRNLSVKHRFVCLSNVNVPCERIPLIHDWQGWWSKIELFRPGIFDDRVLYLDLDVIILKDLMPFFTYPYWFGIIGKDRQFTHRGKDGWEITMYNSSVMVFDPDAVEDLYKEFSETPEQYMNYYRGDQDFIANQRPNLDIFPRHWVMKLRDCPGNVPTKNLKILLCMPGKNERVIRKYKWAKELWI